MKESVAVIDIGSNAVRFVVYDAADRAPVRLHHERALCNLGEGLAATGRLSAAGMKKARRALSRFAEKAGKMGLRNLRAVATAAVRDAENGADFIARVRDDCGLDVRVLTGAEEARLAALGVLAGGAGTDGLVGDYGGGSLELVLVKGGRPRGRVSLPLGSHRLRALATPAARRAAVEAQLAAVTFLEEARGMDFYALGGGWRRMGRLHMEKTRHPLPLLDGYAVPGGAALAFARRTQGPEALVLARLLEKLAPRRVVFSGTGLREGILFASLPAAEKRRDPLIVSARKCGRAKGDGRRFAAAFGKKGERRLAAAAFLLKDVCAFDHAESRAALAFGRVLTLALSGADHAERVLLALALHARYGGGEDPAHPALALLSLAQRRFALRLGRALGEEA